jgi:hypothetical protein
MRRQFLALAILLITAGGVSAHGSLEPSPYDSTQLSKQVEAPLCRAVLIPPQAYERAPVETSFDQSCRPRSECCKVCSKGKACGDTCISATYTCRKGRGCACDSYEICQ